MAGNKKAKSNKGEAIDHARFLRMLQEEFPEVPRAFDEYSKGLLHCEMGTFARLTEEAMDGGRFGQVEAYFKFIEWVWGNATPEVENALHVSFVEYLAFSEVTDNRLLAVRKMPKPLRDILMVIDARGRWA